MSLVHSSLHYAVVEIDIPGKHVVVFDGLYCPLFGWMDHVVSSLKWLRLVAIDNSYNAIHNGEFSVEKMCTHLPVTSAQSYILQFEASP